MPVSPGNFGVDDFAFPASEACDYPDVGNVRFGVAYGSGSFVGTLVLPAVTVVKAGAQYGAGGTEFTGTYLLTAPGGDGGNALQHSPADILRRLLIALELGTDPGPGGAWPIYTASEPDSPDNVVTTYDTAGTEDGSEMITGVRSYHQGVQVRIRATDHATGFAKAQAILVAMDEQIEKSTVAIDGSSYLVWNVVCDNNVLALGKNVPQSKRNLFTINTRVTVNALT